MNPFNQRFSLRQLFIFCIIWTTTLHTNAQLIEDGNDNNDALELLGSVTALEIFMNDFFERNMQELKVPGAVIAIVKEDSIIFSRGYGYANIDKKIPADPANTFFRIGSVSKTIIAAAAMKLVEDGLLNPKEDINNYLKHFKVDSPPGNPITLQHLLTHSAGFDDRRINTRARSYESLSSTTEHLAKIMPSRVRQPGEVISYSNYSFGLLGQLVEDVSGKTLDAFLHEIFFKPLNMKNTLLGPNPDLHENIARAYEWINEAWQEQNWAHYQSAAGGGVVSSAEDMARFTMMHLSPEIASAKNILKKESIHQMHQRLFSHHPDLPGMAWSLFESQDARWFTLGHGGTTNGFRSFLYFLPNEKVGLFIAQNGGQEMASKLVPAFLETFIPAKTLAQPKALAANLQTAPGLLSGNYRINRTSTTLISHATKLAKPEEEVMVIAHKPGEITIKRRGEPHWIFHAKAGRYIEIEPLLFYHTETGDKLAFVKDHTGKIKYLGTTIESYSKAGFRDNYQLHKSWLIFSLLVLLSAIIVWLIGVFKRKTQKLQSSTEINMIRTGFGFIALLLLTFIIAFNFEVRANGANWVYGEMRNIPILLWLPIISLLLTLPTLFYTVKVIYKGLGSIWFRVYSVIISLTLVVTFFFFNYWNLLGFNY